MHAYTGVSLKTSLSSAECAAVPTQRQRCSPRRCCCTCSQPGRLGLQVLARTLRVDYRIPSRPQVSPACVHLISKLLVADPNGRLSTEGIMRHPWFRTNLPPGVEDLNAQCLRMKVCWDRTLQHAQAACHSCADVLDSQACAQHEGMMRCPSSGACSGLAWSGSMLRLSACCGCMSQGGSVAPAGVPSNPVIAEPVSCKSMIMKGCACLHAAYGRDIFLDLRSLCFQ